MKSLVILLCVICATLTQANVEVHAPTGRIRGSIMKTRLGKDIYSFRGIRYAEPPVGERRFQVAQPAADWSDVFDATEEGPGCPRLAATPGNISEDCLRLNVYTTKLPTPGTKHRQVKRPVIVFFHPGAYYIYSGQSYYYGPQYLLDQDVVLVTLNYRMASLGFVSTGDSYAPGNLAFKDQVVALRWVKRNIAAFGGDPNSVTISGCSAGSISVMLHMVSPMSKGLFHKAIAVSDGIVLNGPIPENQLHLTKKQAQLLNCPTDSSEAMISCMKTKPVEDFTATIANFFEYYGDPVLIWTPVVEPEVEGVERFLPDQPANLIRRRKINDVPLIATITRDEFASVAMIFEKQIEAGNYTIINQLNENWYTIAPISFVYERGTPRSRNISTELRNFYLGGMPLGDNNVKGIGLLYADSLVIANAYRSTKLFADYSKQPVYFAKFTYQGRYSYAMWNDTTPYGVVHQDDTQYLFYLKADIPYVQPGAPENGMIDRLTAVWHNFAKTGEPIPKNDKNFEGVVWERYNTSRDSYLDFNMNPTMKNGVYPERMALWEYLFPFPELPACRQHDHDHEHNHDHNHDHDHDHDHNHGHNHDHDHDQHDHHHHH